MKLSSPDFIDGDEIPCRFTCQGEDINPALIIEQVPSDAQSLVLIVDDPDVPERIRADKLWVHWVLYNIAPTTQRIEQNSSVGMVGKNTEGDCEYMGPCPPDRRHRYFFKLYALDIKLSASQPLTKKEVEKLMEGHILATATLMGTYEKSVAASN